MKDIVLKELDASEHTHIQLTSKVLGSNLRPKVGKLAEIRNTGFGEESLYCF